MRRKVDPLLRTVTKEHRKWLSAVHASTYKGKIMPLDYFGITSKRIEILDDMGLIEFKNGLYVLTERGLKEINLTE